MHEAFHDHLFVPIWIVDLRGRKIEIGDQSLVQKIFRYTDPFPLRSSIHTGFLKVSKSQKQISKVSFEQKKILCTFALAFKMSQLKRVMAHNHAD